jgi:AcrR family transcriptional regulator
MQDIAKACGATKSMLYHYFPTKDDLLFAMLMEHLERVVQSVEEAIAGTGSPRDSCW